MASLILPSKTIDPLSKTIPRSQNFLSNSLECYSKKRVPEFEINLDNNVSEENIELKKPNEIYMELYNNALEKAKQAKKSAIDAYLVAKNIKDTYALNIEDEEEYDLI